MTPPQAQPRAPSRPRRGGLDAPRDAACPDLKTTNEKPPRKGIRGGQP